MALKIEIIDEVCQRYRRERDRYRKLTRIIEEQCVNFFVERSGLLVNITARTKSESSLRNKLYRIYSRQEKPEWSSVDDVFEELSDLSGIRIAYYSGSDLEIIENGLASVFYVNKIENKDKYQRGSTHPLYYKAKHLQVELNSIDLSGDNENLIGLSAEIQICSMMAHVWNEIEHDIGYKPSGQLCALEVQLLHELGRLTRSGDEIIENLVKAHQERVLSEDKLENIEALIEFLGKTFAIGRITFRANADSLYSALVRLNIQSKDGLLNAMGIGKPAHPEDKHVRDKWNQAKQDLRKFNQYLRRCGFSEQQLNERKSADPALMLILQHYYKSILLSEPAGRGRGRPSRIRSLATRYKEFVSNKSHDDET